MKTGLKKHFFKLIVDKSKIIIISIFKTFLSPKIKGQQPPPKMKVVD
jgi:hypothetical protein